MRIDNRTDDPSLITVNANGEGETVGDALADACAKANEAWGDEPWITVRQTRHGSRGDVWRVTLETVAARVRTVVYGLDLNVGDLIVGLPGDSPHPAWLGAQKTSDMLAHVSGRILVEQIDDSTYRLDNGNLWYPVLGAHFVVLRPRPVI